ncbi:MAG: TRAP transporter large permease [Lautropia sp.]
MELLLLFGSLVTLMVLGLPVAFAMGLASVLFIAVYGDNLTIAILAQSLTTGINNSPLIAIPLFFLAGEVMNRGGITERLIDCFMAIAGHVRGGLGHVVVTANMAISGISGSAVAEAAMVGPIMIRSMVQSGYGNAYSAALVGTAAILGPIIPPSIPMILYGALADTSVARLFLAGILPGVLIGAYLMVCNHRIAVRRGYGGSTGPRLPMAERIRMVLYALPALFAPVLVIGCMVTGIVTATEAGLVAVFYSALLGFIDRRLNLRILWEILGTVARDSAVILLIVGAGSSFGWIMANLGIGPAIVETLLHISNDKYVILALVNVLLLILGALMDPIAILVLFTPVLVPVMTQLGVDLVHFGVMMILNLMIGLMTPPVGYLLYISASMSGARLRDIVRESIPFMIAMLVCLLVVTYWPYFVLVVPDLLMGPQ